MLILKLLISLTGEVRIITLLLIPRFSVSWISYPSDWLIPFRKLMWSILRNNHNILAWQKNSSKEIFWCALIIFNSNIQCWCQWERKSTHIPSLSLILSRYCLVGCAALSRSVTSLKWDAICSRERLITGAKWGFGEQMEV